ncbi:YihY/virulence factor BrkB family protein [Actinomadura sp. NEAU-AAG7]|uniref:YihY/virulence factor BrkB family protein n=1 Tax=Actinomadura sp. NEAU-AAG7 TaxID=2839640 RepID=UPI001BE4368C|nr:YihY/virulence factor BrkB family protein [Actinomadura sp. NEAU-AAG7]MBT2210535.1 YihY/virulence factor BrkB family protein [Actinomadura sp. NEAU-AAG7]
MRQVITKVRRGSEARIQARLGAGRELLRGWRARWKWFDHLGRAFERYTDRRGERLAAALTYHAFLSFFPLLALAYALLGYLVGVSTQARDYFVKAVNSLLPGLSDELQVEQIAQSKTAVGIVGVAALLFTGLGWVDVLRESLRDIWDNKPTGGGNFASKRLWDLAVLLFLGVILICGIAVSTITTSATHTVLSWMGLEDVTGAGTALRLLSLAVAMAFDTVIFLVLFTRLSGTRAPWRRIARGALFGAVGFELLKQVATLLIGRTTQNPVYASFAVLVGLMVWMNIVSRFVLFVAAWTATRRVVMSADEGNPERTDPGTEPRDRIDPIPNRPATAR